MVSSYWQAQSVATITKALNYAINNKFYLFYGTQCITYKNSTVYIKIKKNLYYKGMKFKNNIYNNDINYQPK